MVRIPKCVGGGVMIPRGSWPDYAPCMFLANSFSGASVQRPITGRDTTRFFLQYAPDPPESSKNAQRTIYTPQLLSSGGVAFLYGHGIYFSHCEGEIRRSSTLFKNLLSSDKGSSSTPTPLMSPHHLAVSLLTAL